MLSRSCGCAIGVAKGTSDGLYLLLAFLVLEVFIAPFWNEVVVQLPIGTSVQARVHGLQAHQLGELHDEGFDLDMRSMMERGELSSPVTALGTVYQCLVTLTRLEEKNRNYVLGCGEDDVVLERNVLAAPMTRSTCRVPAKYHVIPVFEAYESIKETE